MGSASLDSSLAFLADGGEMGRRIRQFDWTSTSLGAPELWPDQLKAMVRLLLTTHHPMFIYWGPDLVQFYNDAYRRSIGDERHPSALGARGRECWAEIWDIIGPQIDLVMSGKGSTWHENHLVPITRNGRREDAYWTYSFSPIDLPEAPHGVGGVLVVCSETSEQMRAERTTQAERDRLKKLFQQAPGFMALLQGPEHRFEMVNPAYQRLVGDRELIGKSVAEALPDAAAQGYVDLLDQVFGSGEAITSHGARVVLDRAPEDPQSERFVDFVYQPIADASGQVIGIFVEGFDVTGAHADSRALRELYSTLEQRVIDTLAERNVLADVVESAEAFILVIDLDYRVMAVNRAYAGEFQRNYGKTLKVGDNLLDRMDGFPARQQRVSAYWDRALAGEDFQVTETSDAAGNGTRFYDARFSALRDRSGTQVGAVAMVYDVTERELAQQQLAEARERMRQAQKIEAIGQLTGGVAHDFNNLLMVISGGLEVMDRLQGPRREKVVAGMRQAVERGAGLSRQLLAFSRRQPLNPEPIDLAGKLGGMRDMLDRSLGGDVQVEVGFEPDLWTVEVDPSELELMVLNLSVNARDAMPDGGCVWIRGRNVAGMDEAPLHGDFVELSVADTGAGMTPEVLTRVFEPFFTTKDVGKGSGLGLAQAHGFATASGGAVRIHSHPGVGTTVAVYLPRSLKPAPGLPADVVAGDSFLPSRVQGTLLLVEDDDEVAALTCELVQTLGYEVIRVENSAAALGALANGRVVDLVFSDVMMPGKMDGIALSLEVRRRRPELPVLLTTGHVEAARLKTEALGIPVLAKPYRLSELEDALTAARDAARRS